MTSDDILLADPSLGRCHLCKGLTKIKTMVEIQVDVPGVVAWICPGCVEKESGR